MSNPQYVYLPLESHDVVPQILGLGVTPFVWPNADSHQGWLIPHDSLGIELRVGDTSGDKLFPWARSFITVLGYPNDAPMELFDFNDDLASALGGIRCSEFERSANRTERAEMKRSGEAAFRAGPTATLLPKIRAAMFGSRYLPSSAEGTGVIQWALNDPAADNAVAVLRFWNQCSLRNERTLRDELLATISNLRGSGSPRLPWDLDSSAS